MELRWRAIPNTQDLYDASDAGVLRSRDRIVVQKNGVVRPQKGIEPLLPHVNDNGYHEYSLYVPGRPRKVVQGQILVLLAWVGPRPPGKTHVRHLDGNPGNNRLENLVWATPAENRADMTAHGRDHYAIRERCKWGHPYEDWNIRYPKKEGGGKRICRACNCATGALWRNGTDRVKDPGLFKIVSGFYLEVLREGRDPRGCLTPGVYASLLAAASGLIDGRIPEQRSDVGVLRADEDVAS